MMEILKLITWLKVERDFKLTGLMEKTGVREKHRSLYSLLKFRMNQNEDLYEILIGIRDFDGSFKKAAKGEAAN